MQFIPIKLYWEPKKPGNGILLINDLPLEVDSTTWHNTVDGVLRLYAQGYAAWSYDAYKPLTTWTLAFLTAQERQALHAIIEKTQNETQSIS